MKKKNAVPKPPASVSHMVDEVVGCKWSVTVLALITSGMSRPGAIQRRVRGLTAKVLNERLKKLLRFGIIERQIFAEVPPRIEYRLTSCRGEVAHPRVVRQLVERCAEPAVALVIELGNERR